MAKFSCAAILSRPTIEVARSLIGKYLVRENEQGSVTGRIVEVEAYVGPPEDKACHASKGRTARTEVLFGPPGHAYVYLCYGMHEMLNVVTEQDGFPAAILLRAVECDGMLIDGPGRLTRAFGIDRRLNRCDLTAGEAPLVRGSWGGTATRRPENLSTDRRRLRRGMGEETLAISTANGDGFKTKEAVGYS